MCRTSGWSESATPTAWRHTQKHGVIAAASTDAPVVPTTATVGLQTMMTRRDVNGEDGLAGGSVRA